MRCRGRDCRRRLLTATSGGPFRSHDSDASSPSTRLHAGTAPSSLRGNRSRTETTSTRSLRPSRRPSLPHGAALSASSRCPCLLSTRTPLCRWSAVPSSFGGAMARRGATGVRRTRWRRARPEAGALPSASFSAGLSPASSRRVRRGGNSRQHRRAERRGPWSSPVSARWTRSRPRSSIAVACRGGCGCGAGGSFSRQRHFPGSAQLRSTASAEGRVFSPSRGVRAPCVSELRLHPPPANRAKVRTTTGTRRRPLKGSYRFFIGDWWARTAFTVQPSRYPRRYAHRSFWAAAARLLLRRPAGTRSTSRRQAATRSFR
jgi:hypothetical protein